MKIILPILFTLISIAAFIFGVNPLYKEVKELKSSILVYDTALSNSTNLQKIEDSLIGSYNEIKSEDKDRLNKFLPTSVNNIQFILEVERIANLHNMPIKDVKFDVVKKEESNMDSSNIVISQNTEDEKPYGVFPLSFVTEGDYNSFNLFLKDLERNLRLSDIKSISISIPDVSNLTNKDAAYVDPNIYRYTLEVETYWLK